MKTVVHNSTKKTVVLVGFSNVLFEKIKPGRKSEIILNPDATYGECCFEVNSSSETNTFFVPEDCAEWRSIEVRPRKDDPTKFEWKGIERKTDIDSSLSQAAWKDASGSMEALASFSVELEKDEKRVVIYRAQCANLVKFCSQRVQKIREIFSLLTHVQMIRLYLLRKLPQLTNSLDSLLRALLSAQKLLKGCGQKEWRRAALVLSLPPPDPQNLEKYSGSRFFLIIRELGCSFDLVQYAMGEAGDREFKWDDGIDCRYVLRNRNQAQDGVADDEMELLEGDRDREIRDHKELLSDLENGSLLKDSDFSISLAGWLWYTFPLWNFAATIQKWCLARWLWYNFLIALAGWFWYDFFISLARWLWYIFPLWNFAATIQKCCLAGCSWYNSSHVKFTATIQNRCQNQNSDIDVLDLQKKKFLGRGGFKEVHKGKWVGTRSGNRHIRAQKEQKITGGF